eukprot:g69820.t1
MLQDGKQAVATAIGPVAFVELPAATSQWRLVGEYAGVAPLWYFATWARVCKGFRERLWAGGMAPAMSPIALNHVQVMKVPSAALILWAQTKVVLSDSESLCQLTRN